MVADVVTLGAVAAIGGVATWLGSVLVQSLRSRDRRYEIGREADLKLEEHRDGLTFQLLEAARVELTSLRNEVSRLRPMEAHLIQFEEALHHIELMLFPGDTSRADVERHARAFLNRVRRVQTATGTMLNEAQRLDSTVEMVSRTQPE